MIVPHMGMAGKEYLWNEPVALVHFPPGDRLSQDYNAAALTLEYACALTGLSDSNTLSAMRARLEDYFSLVSGDTRLEALSSVLTAASRAGEPASEAYRNPNNIGETLQFWLQQEQRTLFGNFLARFLSDFSTGEPDLIRVLRESLDVESIRKTDTDNISPLELGSKVVQALAPLFTD
jgi:hypothetical protein